MPVNGFKLITKENTRKIKESALYNLISELSQENSSLLAKYKVEASSNPLRQAFFIRLVNSTPGKTYAAYESIDKHLTIDRQFAEATTETGKNGFSIAHYSEEFSRLDNREDKLKVHIYFDRQARIISIQTKRFIANEETEIAEEFSAKIEDIVKENSNAAADLLKKLNLEKSNRYFQATEESRKLEDILQDTLKKCSPSSHQKGKEKRKKPSHNPQEYIKKYLSLAESYYQQIELINRYSDTKIDTRDRLVRQICEQLAEFSINTQTIVATGEEKVKEDSSTASKINFPKTTQRANPTKKDILDSLKHQITETLAKIKENYKPKRGQTPSAKQLVEKSKLIDEAQAKLLELSWLTNTADQKISSLEEGLNQHMTNFGSLKKHFLKLAKQGNIKALKLLLPYIETQLCFGDYLDLIEQLDQQNNNLLIKVFDFLYQESSSYLLFINAISKLTVMGNKATGLGFSILIGACLDKKLELFKMLLRHGVDVNQIGITFKTTCIPTITAVIAFTEDNTEYVFELLKYGARTQISPQQFDITTCELSKNLMCTSFNSPQPRHKTLFRLRTDILFEEVNQKFDSKFKSTVEKLASCTTAFEVMISYNLQPDLIDPLTQDIEPLFLLEFLIHLSLSDSITMRLIYHAKQAGIYTCYSENLENLSVEMLTSEVTLDTPCAYIIYNKETPYNPKVEKKLCAITELVFVLKEQILKLEKVSPEQYNKLFLELLKRANPEQELFSYISNQQSLLFLYALKPKLNSNDRKSLARLFYSIAQRASKEGEPGGNEKFTIINAINAYQINRYGFLAKIVGDTTNELPATSFPNPQVITEESLKIKLPNDKPKHKTTKVFKETQLPSRLIEETIKELANRPPSFVKELDSDTGNNTAVNEAKFNQSDEVASTAIRLKP